MEINSNNYVENVLRTDCDYNVELHERLLSQARMLHAVLGMVTEVAELADMIKKFIFYNKPFDKVNAKEECGDASWYIGLAIDEMKATMNEVLSMNIAKLRLRYPNKFNGKDAIGRNVEAERELLENLSPKKSPGLYVQQFAYADVSDKEYCQMNNIKYDFNEPCSKRGQDWLEFSQDVFNHIENYTVPQYGDKGNDQATDWIIEHLLEEVKKYINRYDKVIPERQVRDFLKMAHYVQIAATKYDERNL